MKNKYMLNMGLAFSEQSMIDKLNQFAKQGWLLEKFSFAGFFFKLVKGQPTDHIYCMDIQHEITDDYLLYFEQAGWKHVYSSNNTYHFFQAPEGTRPIYGDPITENQRNDHMIKISGRLAFLSATLFVLINILDNLASDHLAMLSPICMVMSILCLIVFMFSFMPWLSYQSKKRRA